MGKCKMITNLNYENIITCNIIYIILYHCLSTIKKAQHSQLSKGKRGTRIMKKLSLIEFKLNLI